MISNKPDIAVALIIYRRPEITEQSFRAIARSQPANLLIVADGPRRDKPGEYERVEATRKVVENVDWDCNVQYEYADSNLGLAKRVYSGLDWVFSQVEQAIILEDDCIPDPSFFSFCSSMLERYRDDNRIMSVAGNNFQQGRKRTKYSCYFSLYPHSTGWATWRRAWRFYDHEMKLWPELRDSGWLNDILGKDIHAVKYWTRIFDRVYRDEIDSWAYRWTLACWAQSGLAILPNENLVANIGFGEEATHAISRRKQSKFEVKRSMEFPLTHPSFMIRDSQADKFTQANHYGTNLANRLKRTAARELIRFRLLRG